MSSSESRRQKVTEQMLYRRLRIQVVYVDFCEIFILFYHLITLVTADVLVYCWHKYSAEKWIYLQKCK